MRIGGSSTTSFSGRFDGRRLIASIRRELSWHSLGWIAPSLALALILGTTVGSPYGWLLYWGFNVAGVWMYCDANGTNKPRMQRALKVASFILLPSGVLGLLAGGGPQSFAYSARGVDPTRATRSPGVTSSASEMPAL